MKISSCLLGLVGLGFILYYLFQPIIDMNFGWNTIPKDVSNAKFEGLENPSYSREIRQAKQLIDGLHQTSRSPSISIAALINGKMVWTYAVGFQDLEKKIIADTSTQYRIGSTSKALTSLGLAKLIQDRQIHPDSSIQYYTNMFLDKPHISIRQLASHQSGIRNYGICACFPIWEYYRNKKFDSIEESVLEFESDELLFAPGDGFLYSSFNFTTLSLAMDYTTENGFLSYMENDVFNTLSMKKTTPDKNDGFSENRAIPYETRGNMYRKSITVNLSNKWAGGGYLSTPSDLVRAGNALLDTTFIGSETINRITSPQRLNNDSINEQNYAMGWRHSFSSRYFNGTGNVEVIHHGGMAMGGLALLVVYPEYDLVLAITLNKSGVQGNFKLFDYITPIANAFLKSIDENNS